jgi:thioesterase domain-containing protein
VDAEALLAYLNTHIPISAALGVGVAEASAERVRVTARLEPNLNHRATAFGGSVAAVAILAAWGLLRVRVDDVRPVPHLVIQRSTVDYLLPIESDFEAICASPSPEGWPRFHRAFTRRGRGRIDLHVDVLARGALAARFHGAYAALDAERTA